jgi:hypothetical protein
MIHGVLTLQSASEIIRITAELWVKALLHKMNICKATEEFNSKVALADAAAGSPLQFHSKHSYFIWSAHKRCLSTLPVAGVDEVLLALQ